MGRSRFGNLGKISNIGGECGTEDFSSLFDLSPDLSDSLRDKGIFYLVGEISDQSCLPIHHSLLLYTQQKPPKNGMTIIINSPGGNLQTAWSLIDLMTLMKPVLPIRTVAIGDASSAASLILAAGTPGQRYVGENCSMTLHDAMYFFSDMPHKTGDLIAITKDLKLEQERLIRFWTSISGETDIEIIKETFMSQNDSPVNAEQAIKLGLADTIITSLASPFSQPREGQRRKKE